MTFTNWVELKENDLKLEYKVEVLLKGMDKCFGSFEEFLKRYKKAPVKTVTKSFDKQIEYRSRTPNKESLLSLIKTYRSYPEFRNEKTLDAIYQGFSDNKPMKMPIILKMKGNRYRVLGGNTRMDVAFHLGINPKVKVVDVSDLC